MKCKNCETELTHDKKRDCFICLNCNPIPKSKPEPVEEEKKYLDVKVTDKQADEMIAERLAKHEGRIRELVRDGLENWHIKKPPVTKAETKVMTATEILQQHNEKGEVSSSIVILSPADWRTQAKELGIKTFQRKKADVLAEIKAKTLNK